MNWKDFFKLTKRKIILSVILVVGWPLIDFFIRWLVSLAREKDAAIMHIIPGNYNYDVVIPTLIITLLISLIFYYPFACYISSLLDFKTKKKNIFSPKRIVILVLLILIFNPFFLRLLFAILFLLWIFSSRNFFLS